MTTVDAQVIAIVKRLLGGLDYEMMHLDTLLIGEWAEFDSMSVLNLLAALENKFGFIVDDDEVVPEIFISVRSVSEFVSKKLSELDG